MEKLTLAQAKQVNLVYYLASLGHHPDPKMSRNHEYWYLSPLPSRNEKTPSFKVDHKQNLWYDHSIGIGGSIIEFGMQYHGCTIPEFLDKLQLFSSFHRTHFPQESPGPVKKTGRDSTAPSFSSEGKKIHVLSAGSIVSPALINYLVQRKIPVDLAQTYCREVRYEIRDKQYYAIGFPNNAGGYELRNPHFKGCSSPKDTTFFDNGAQQVAVFEGFFSFLSFLTVYQNRELPATNFLVLNSLSLFEKSRPVMEQHGTINLYLDRDIAGMKRTEQVAKESSTYNDCSFLYKNCKDLNDWLIQKKFQLQQKIYALNRARKISDDMMNRQVSQKNQNEKRL